jgi:MFS family permease
LAQHADRADSEPKLATQCVTTSACADTRSMASLKPILLVFTPFAVGYYLSYLFRVINAVVAKPLTDELGLDAAQLGLLTSIYFLTFAAVQLPLGAALDRFGSRRVQATLLMFAAVGAMTFALAPGFAGLLIGRGLIGIGVSGALIAGLKAIAEWFPKKRLQLINGAFVAFGAAGAVTATLPVQWLLACIDWRGVFLLLGVAAGAMSLVVMLVVLDPPKQQSAPHDRRSFKIRAIYADCRFWRLAPVSALCIGSAWALQGLWAAPWLADVASLGRDEVVHHLFVMAMALCVGALLIGVVADALSRRGIGPDTVLVSAVCLFIAAELAIVCRLPLPTVALWALVGGMGAATVLSYAMLADLFPAEAAGRANGALNVLHIGGAFAIQGGIGLVVGLWSRDLDGRYPPVAYQAAFLIIVVLQVAALLWFIRLSSRSRVAPLQVALSLNLPPKQVAR